MTGAAAWYDSTGVFTFLGVALGGGLSYGGQFLLRRSDAEREHRQWVRDRRSSAYDSAIRYALSLSRRMHEVTERRLSSSSAVSVDDLAGDLDEAVTQIELFGSSAVNNMFRSLRLQESAFVNAQRATDLSVSERVTALHEVQRLTDQLIEQFLMIVREDITTLTRPDGVRPPGLT
jgi:hypothetical protein